MSKVFKNHTQAFRGILELQPTAETYEEKIKCHKMICRIMNMMIEDNQERQMKNVVWNFFKKYNPDSNFEKIDVLNKFYEYIQNPNIEIENIYTAPCA